MFCCRPLAGSKMAATKYLKQINLHIYLSDNGQDFINIDNIAFFIVRKHQCTGFRHDVF